MKIVGWGGLHTRVGRGRMAEAGHKRILEGHMEVEKHRMRIGMYKNFVRRKVVGLGKHLAKSRLGLGMEGC